MTTNDKSESPNKGESAPPEKVAAKEAEKSGKTFDQKGTEVKK